MGSLFCKYSKKMYISTVCFYVSTIKLWCNVSTRVYDGLFKRSECRRRLRPVTAEAEEAGQSNEACGRWAVAQPFVSCRSLFFFLFFFSYTASEFPSFYSAATFLRLFRRTVRQTHRLLSLYALKVPYCTLFSDIFFPSQISLEQLHIIQKIP